MPLAQMAPPSLVRARLGVSLWVQDPLNLYVIMSKKKCTSTSQDWAHFQKISTIMQHTDKKKKPIMRHRKLKQFTIGKKTKMKHLFKGIFKWSLLNLYFEVLPTLSIIFSLCHKIFNSLSNIKCERESERNQIK